MKKVFTVLVAITISAASFSQVSVGVQGVVNSSKAKTNTESADNVSKSALIAPGGGVIAEFSIGKNLGVRPAITYVQHGFRLKGEINGDLPDGASSAKFDGKTVLGYV